MTKTAESMFWNKDNMEEQLGWVSMRFRSQPTNEQQCEALTRNPVFYTTSIFSSALSINYGATSTTVSSGPHRQ